MDKLSFLELLNFFKSNPRRDYPLSQISPHRVPRKNLVFKSGDFKQLLQENLTPRLNEAGFSGMHYRFMNEYSTHWEIISIGRSKYGGAISIDLGIKFKQPYSIGEFDIHKIYLLAEAESHIRLSPDDNDNWWTYQDTKLENLRVIDEMWKLITIKGFRYFNKFKDLKAFMNTIQFHDIETEKLYTKYFLSRYEIRVYFFLMRHYELNHGINKSLFLAKKGLESIKLDSDEVYRKAFEDKLGNE